MFDVHPISPFLNGVTDIRFDKYYDKSEHLCYPKLCTTNLSLFKAGYFTCALMMYVQIKQAELLVFEFFQLMVMVNLASLVFCATNIPFKHMQ